MTDLAAIQLRTLFTFDDDGFMLHTREPHSTPAPRLCIIRTADAVAWAVRADTPDEVAALAATERPAPDLEAPPRHAARYRELLSGDVVAGPAFLFPDGAFVASEGAEAITDAAVVAGLIGADEFEQRRPVFAVVEGGRAVSVCHSARWSEVAAEAGVFTRPSHRGRGLAPRVTAAWAAAVRTSDRVPIYSTSWGNEASRAVAAKLGLRAFGSDFSVS